MPAGMTGIAGAVVEVAEGTIYRGSSWKALCATTVVVGTTTPNFYPRRCGGTATLVAGTLVLGVAEALYVFSTTTCPVTLTRNTPNTSVGTDGGYQCEVAGRTAGRSGTGALTLLAAVLAGTINNADISTIDWNIQNW